MMMSHSGLKSELQQGYGPCVPLMAGIRLVLWDVMRKGGPPYLTMVTLLVLQVVMLAELMKRIDAVHGRLALELLSILRAAGYIESDAPGSFTATNKLDSPELQAALAGISTQKLSLQRELVPDLATNVELVWVCMQALPDILTGDLQCSLIEKTCTCSHQVLSSLRSLQAE